MRRLTVGGETNGQWRTGLGSETPSKERCYRARGGGGGGGGGLASKGAPSSKKGRYRAQCGLTGWCVTEPSVGGGRLTGW